MGEAEQLSEITGDESTKGNIKIRLSIPTCKAAFMDSQNVEQLGVGQAAEGSEQPVLDFDEWLVCLGRCGQIKYEEVKEMTLRDRIEGILHNFIRAIPRGAYDDHERETLEKVLGTQASARRVGLSVHLVYWSVIYPAFRGSGEGYLRHGAHDEDNHDQLYAECLAAFGHVKTDLVTTARRKRVKDIRVNGALLPVVVLAVKRSVDDILSRTYAYLELEEGKALLQQGLSTLSEIIDAG